MCSTCFVSLYHFWLEYFNFEHIPDFAPVSLMLIWTFHFAFWKKKRVYTIYSFWGFFEVVYFNNYQNRKNHFYIKTKNTFATGLFCWVMITLIKQAHFVSMFPFISMHFSNDQLKNRSIDTILERPLSWHLPDQS